MAVTFFSIFLTGCFTTGGNIQSFSDIQEKEWKLVQVYINGVDTQFRRVNQPEMLGDIFTLTFDREIVSGTGAPNLFSAPYTLGDGQSINIMVMRSTLMAPLFEPENLSEHEYFTFLQNASTWRLVRNRLEIYSTTQDGREVRLVFAL